MSSVTALSLQPQHPVRILLADDHRLVRAGIRRLLEDRPTIDVVAEAGTGKEAVAAVQTHHPDLILMDIWMPEMSGVDALRAIRQVSPETRVIFLSQHDHKEYVRQALDAGAMGYLPKAAAPDELHQAIRAVMRGEYYVSPSIPGESPLAATARAHKREGFDSLSPRQREVFLRLAQGQSVKEIAADLGISAKTVETHRAIIVRRLHVRSVVELVRYAFRLGVIRPDS